VQPVGTVRVYDHHIFLGTSTGTASINQAGAATGFNNQSSNAAATSTVYDAFWQEQ
jgi:hypothetical protein